MFRFTGLTRASLFSRSPSRMKIPLVLDTDTQVALRVSQTSNRYEMTTGTQELLSKLYMPMISL
jgi:hypothetical protein